MEHSLPEFLIFCGSILLMAMLLMELLDWSLVLSAFECNPSNDYKPKPFMYGTETGPNTWQCTYPNAKGKAQSPVNIVGRAATVLELSKPLRWHGYQIEPFSISLANDGNTVVLFGNWTSYRRPRLEGGPLEGIYEFRSAVFRWGPSDDEGSEHSLDYVRYPLELQALHAPRVTVSQCSTGLVIISYMFQITSDDNPYLDHVVQNLWRVSRPGACAQVPAFPLEWIMPSFKRKYYTYKGSLTHPPCSETVTWIVYPEAVAISANQIAQFRKICSMEGPIISNSRPVQKLNERDILYYA